MGRPHSPITRIVSCYWTVGFFVFERGITFLKDSNLLIQGRNHTFEGHYDSSNQFLYLDTLTGLPNRESFLALLESKEQEAKNHLILSIGLSHTEVINALRGPVVFDSVITEAKNRIMNSLPPEVITARIGTNQFCVVAAYDHFIDAAAIVKVAKEIQEKLDNLFFVDGEEYYIASYIGASIRNYHEYHEQPPLTELVHLSDLAVIARKNEIYRNVYLYDSSIKRSQETLHKLELALRSDVEDQKLLVMYQPIVNLSNQVISLESLVRWHYGGEWIPPKDFIPIIEKLDLIKEMTLHVVKQAAKDWKMWKEKIPTLSYISINISPHLFRHDEGTIILQPLMELLNQYGLSPKEICLEITKNVFIESSTHAFLKKCHDLGFILAIDDFGTGYSSIGYLIKYPFDLLKMDQEFINRMEVDEKLRTIALSIVKLAQKLNIRVIAEGVETIKQLHILKEMGVHAVQGYYFSKPQLLDKWDSGTFDERRNSFFKLH